MKSLNLEFSEESSVTRRTGKEGSEVEQHTRRGVNEIKAVTVYDHQETLSQQPPFLSRFPQRRSLYCLCEYECKSKSLLLISKKSMPLHPPLLHCSGYLSGFQH